MTIFEILIKLLGGLGTAIAVIRLIIKWIDPAHERKRRATKNNLIARAKRGLFAYINRRDKGFAKWGWGTRMFFAIPLVVFIVPVSVISYFRHSHEGLRPRYFFPSEFVDVKSFAEKLKPGTTNELTRYLFANLSTNTMAIMGRYRTNDHPLAVEEELKNELAGDLNRIITTDAFFNTLSTNSFFDRTNILEKSAEIDQFRLNKMVVQDAYPSEIEPRIQPRSVGIIFRVLATILVYFMQFGFIAFEAGEVHKSYRLGSAVKNFLVFIVAFASYITVGPYLQGVLGNSVLGHQTILDLAFHAGFASTIALIVANALSERTTNATNFILAALSAGVGYPVLSGLLWENGYLFHRGFTDTAGACVVHMLGGVIGFYSALYVGSSFRTQAWHFLNKPQEPDQRSLIPLTVVGGLFLWFGWLGFNSGNATTTAELENAFLNTSLGACGGALASVAAYLVASRHIKEKWQGRRPEVPATILAMADLERVVVGAMGGLVCVTANASHVTRFDAVCESFIGGLVAVLMSCVLSGRHRKRVDDPLGAIATHAGAGFVGIVATPFLIEGASEKWAHLVVQLQGCAICVVLGCLIVCSTRLLIWCSVHLAKDRCRNGKRVPWCLRLLRLRLSSHRQATGKEGFEVLGPPPHFHGDEDSILACFEPGGWDPEGKSARLVGQYLMAEERAASDSISEQILEVVGALPGVVGVPPEYNERERFALVAVVLLNVGHNSAELAELLDLFERCLHLERCSSEHRNTIAPELDQIKDIVKKLTNVTAPSSNLSDDERPNLANLLQKLSKDEVDQLLRRQKYLPKDFDEKLLKSLDKDNLEAIKSELKRLRLLSQQACVDSQGLYPNEMNDLFELFGKLLPEQVETLLSGVSGVKAGMGDGTNNLEQIDKYRAVLVWTITYLAEDLATSREMMFEGNTETRKRGEQLFKDAHTRLEELHKQNSSECRLVHNLAWIGALDLEFSLLGHVLTSKAVSPSISGGAISLTTNHQPPVPPALP